MLDPTREDSSELVSSIVSADLSAVSHPLSGFFLTRLRQRHRAERRFLWYGRLSIGVVLLVFLVLLGGLVLRGIKALTVVEIGLPFSDQRGSFDRFPGSQPELLPGAKRTECMKCLQSSMISGSPKRVFKFKEWRSLLYKALSEAFPDMGEQDRLEIADRISPGAFRVFQFRSSLQGLEQSLDKKSYPMPLTWLPFASLENIFETPPSWVASLKEKNMLQRHFNQRFFTQTDSRSPEMAGLLGGVIGSFYLLLMTWVISFPLAIGAALYLEEFTEKVESKLLPWIDASLSNLASVPSIVFGLLGLAIFINWLNLPRSSTLVGAFTLSMMTLPILIISSRTALKAVPHTIREAAFALGASRVQVVFHHVFPLALPGILTGTIISMARILGETAPLLMIGMMAFVIDLPCTPWDPASALPVQIFNWVRNPEPGFINLAAAGILVLLVFLIIMNLGAILLRKQFEYKWS